MRMNVNLVEGVLQLETRRRIVDELKNWESGRNRIR